MFKIHIKETSPIFISLFKSSDTVYDLQNVLHFSAAHLRNVFNETQSISWAPNGGIESRLN